ncbi:ent-kaurene synthase TSP4, chloroplastic isoform X2 [Hevea brasiliensis]|uniref:ent-kaurene synthase TSP4, chloroplastic isoform X2 n=1 Tax=Hevea brasiliensis TaxID=3981 RepID=UPI000B771469|nr:ent-kaurene synthase TSP4, chloroplastic isoform X2 [Hevea brasiliensis]
MILKVEQDERANVRDLRSGLVTEVNTSIQWFDGTKERIKKMFDKIELSVSSYDTAWVAMVPSPNTPEAPFFPECAKWIVDNQLSDGSWGLPHRHPLLVKDALSSTLACVLALKRWGIGENQINKGLQFIELNSASLTDQKQHTPFGFDITFPGMLEHAKDLALNLPLKSEYVDAMLCGRDLELRSGYGGNTEARKAYLAYVSEGLGKLQDWKMVMNYQRKNGSLFNSPSTTAAAFSHLQDADCLRYLQSVLEKFGNAVPTIYPLDMYARLSMVDMLERLGIDRHFRKEIKFMLDETYGYWLQGNEEIFLDCATCAMAFRILRVNGYEVSSDMLTQFTKECFFSSLGGYLKDTRGALELFKASQIIYPDESLLEKQNSWTNHFLKQELSSGSIYADRLGKHLTTEVQDALNFPYYADLERLSNRRSIEHYTVDETRILKTSYRCSNIGNEHFLKLAVEDFNVCQSVHREELEHLARWVMEKRLDKLKFARQKLDYCYFSSAATLFAPELSDARMSWAKNAVLTTVVDDFFDVGGSEEELVNLIQLIEKWDVDGSTHCCSEHVEILFSALHSTICEIGDKAFTWQGRKVTSHIIEIWLDLLKSMFTETRWSRIKMTPTLDEYMTNGYVSIALGPIVLPALYFVGPKLTEEEVRNPELHDLFKAMSTCGRLLNDWRGFQRESKEGKLNAVSLHMIHGSGVVTEEEAIRKLKDLISSHRRQLLRLVLRENNSIIPRPCKDLFWKMIKVLHLFYMKDDGFTLDEMINAANAVVAKPISFHELENLWMEN